MSADFKSSINKDFKRHDLSSFSLLQCDTFRNVFVYSELSFCSSPSTILEYYIPDYLYIR